MVTPRAANSLLGVQLYLRDHARISPLVAGRVHGAEVPRSLLPRMPMQTICLSGAGGPGGGLSGSSMSRWGDDRIDVLCYGRTPFEADQLHFEARLALTDLDRKIVEGIMLYTAVLESGPISLRDDGTDWPLTFSSWRIKYNLEIVE